MTATAEQIFQLRLLVDEPDDAAPYNEERLAALIEAEARLDPRGEAPGVWDASTAPPTWVANAAWIPTYDLHAAAAAVWEEKAAVLAQDYDFSADGGDYSRSQAYRQAVQQAHYHRSRRMAQTMAARTARVLATDAG